MKEKRAAFTLIELLVVMGIIAMLFGMVYAATGGVREKARQTNCISNLSQFGKAFHMYLSDYGIEDDARQISRIGGSGMKEMHLKYAKAEPLCPVREFLGHDGYMYPFLGEFRYNPDYPSFPAQFHVCGSRTLISADVNHHFSDDGLPRPDSILWLMLRYDGSVTRKIHFFPAHADDPCHEK